MSTERQDHELEVMRHSAAHLMAAAISELYPGARFGVGPAIENGFYYDVATAEPITAEALPKIEKRMREIRNRREKYLREELPFAEAITLFRGLGQDLKVELLQDLATKGTTRISAKGGSASDGKDEAAELDLAKPRAATVYRTGKFVDLCRGPHVADTGAIGAFKLTKVAGAYWRGDEKKPMLTRIYGLAFRTQAELEAQLAMLAEAERRDHRKLGAELDLFTFSDLVGPGLPLWTPKGALLRDLLDSFVWQLRAKRGYAKVEIPHITKKDLYERSGHWEKYKDDLFKFKTREGHEFAMKPMNCPHHTQIYARKLWSYRDLPQRYANSTMCYRDEQTGELSGLSRVRAFTQDDAHVFCRLGQTKEEFLKIWDIIHEFYPTFGFELRTRLSLHDPAHPEKYLGDQERWATAEGILREIVEEKKLAWFEGVGEAAFYGPKLDFMAKDAIGREWQVATIQLDLNMPDRFDLVCTNEQGERERVVMIHAAIMGSIERFLSILIEHTAGALPLWLAPVQVAVIPVGEKHVRAAKKLAKLIAAAGVRVEVNEANETVGYKIRKSEKQKVPYMLVLGDQETKSKSLTVRLRGQKEVKKMTVAAFQKRLRTEIEKRK